MNIFFHMMIFVISTQFSLVQAASNEALETTSPSPSILESPAVLEATTLLLQTQEPDPKSLTQLSTLIQETHFRFNAKLDSAQIPNTDGRVTYNLGIHLDYGWMPWAQISLNIPQLLFHDGPTRETRFLEELGLSASFLVIKEEPHGADISLTPGFSVYDSGIALLGTTSLTKRSTDRLRVDAVLHGRFRTHYSLSDYGLVSLMTGIAWCPWTWMGLALSTQAWFFSDSVNTIAEDLAFGRKNTSTTNFPSMMYSLIPKLSFSVRDNTSIALDARIIINTSARAWFGHSLGVGFESRM